MIYAPMDTVKLCVVNRKMQKSAYSSAGVDIELSNRLKAQLPRLLARARRPEMLGQVGGFGGLFALDLRRYRRPVLVSSVDGVGTKLKVAFMMDRHDTVGQDLVNHCVNDIVVQGAEPLFFLDYIATGRLEPRVFTELISGLARACARNKCALIGGETAQMPGFYAPGEYDVAGMIVGVVERDQILDGHKSVRPGDAVIGIASSGLHTNGYSLARKILFERLRLSCDSYVEELGTTVGEELLKIHVSYGSVILEMLEQFNLRRRSGARSRIIKACAHITGGGFFDNIPRVLPPQCDVVIRLGSWPVPPVFTFLAQAGRIQPRELYHVFNMGIGMVLIVQADAADQITEFIRARKHRAWIIGDVIKGAGNVKLA